METRKLPRWANMFAILAWVSMGVGVIQIFVADADFRVILPGFIVLVLIALPEWLSQSQVPPRDSSGR